MKNHKELIGWLNDAHGMELSLTEVLQNHANDAKEFPEIQQQILKHLAETKEHAKTVERCLATLDEKPSMMKGIMGKTMGMVHGAATGVFPDELVKNALADYAAEHMEIASYLSLIAAAEAEGLTDIAEACESILKDEQAMADWLEEQIPEITTNYLAEHAEAS